VRIGSLFSGIGGLDLGVEVACARAGVASQALWQVEVDGFCRQVLARHWPEVDRSVEDVRHAGSATLASVDLIVGGFPCQDVSAAGRGAGIAVGTRSGLWYEYRRIVDELRPAAAIVENVASGAKRWLCEVRSDLHALGYRTRALAISAADVGAPHLRRSQRRQIQAQGPRKRRRPGVRGARDDRAPAMGPHHDGVSMTVHPSFLRALRECERWGVAVDLDVPFSGILRRGYMPKETYHVAPQDMAGIRRDNGSILWADEAQSTLEASHLIHEMMHVVVWRETGYQPQSHAEDDMLALEREACRRLRLDWTSHMAGYGVAGQQEWLDMSMRERGTLLAASRVAMERLGLMRDGKPTYLRTGAIIDGAATALVERRVAS